MNKTQKKLKNYIYFKKFIEMEKKIIWNVFQFFQTNQNGLQILGDFKKLPLKSFDKKMNS